MNNNNPEDVSWHNPPIDNKNKQYARLYSAVLTCDGSLKELDEIVQIVKWDFLGHKEPIEHTVVSNSTGAITSTLTADDY
jgi:hypothetical protein